MSAIITAMTTVWTAVMQWIGTAVNSIVPIFYTAPTSSNGSGEFTFLGVLALIGLGISVFFLLFGLIQNFIHLRG